MLLQAIIYLLLATHPTITQSQPLNSTTCTNPNGCTWHCAQSTLCNNITYNCTSIASSCTLTCVSCNGTSIISSSDNFNLICVGTQGCTNMDIIAATPQNHIHIITAAEPTTSPTPNPTINQSIIPIYQYTTNKPSQQISTTININQNTMHNLTIDEIISENDENVTNSTENIDAIGGLLTFAGILTGMFCFCICIGICFVCHTKRKSKLRKNTFNENQYETVDIGDKEAEQDPTNINNSQLSKEIIQELKNKMNKRKIINNQTLTHINTNISDTNINQLQITKTITPFSINDIENNNLIKQITPRITIGNTISEYNININENKKLNEDSNDSNSETEVNDDSIDMTGIAFDIGDPIVIKSKGRGRHYNKIESVTNGLSINIETVNDELDVNDDSENDDDDDVLHMKPEKSSSVRDLVSMYNNL